MDAARNILVDVSPSTTTSRSTTSWRLMYTECVCVASKKVAISCIACIAWQCLHVLFCVVLSCSRCYLLLVLSWSRRYLLLVLSWSRCYLLLVSWSRCYLLLVLLWSRCYLLSCSLMTSVCHMQVVVRNQAEHILFCFIQRVTLNEWCEFVSRSSETAQTYIKHVLLHHHRWDFTHAMHGVAQIVCCVYYRACL